MTVKDLLTVIDECQYISFYEHDENDESIYKEMPTFYKLCFKDDIESDDELMLRKVDFILPEECGGGIEIYLKE